MADSTHFATWLPLNYNLDLRFPSFARMSTTPGSFPQDEPLQAVPEENITHPPKFEFTWQDLRSCTQYINDKGWSQAQIPAILEILPENIIISPQLQRILQWSLQRFDEPISDESTTIQDHDGTTDISTVPRADLPKRSNTVVVASRAHTDETTTIPARAKSQRTLPLLARLKQLRQDVAGKVALSSSPSSSVTKDSQAASADSTAEVNTNGECISCFDEFPKWNLVHLKCSHDYCKPCLREVVFTAMKNEAAFPPKCCLTEIPLKTVLVSLENKQRDEYREKSAEYAIPAGHRWYCPEPKCSKWIKPESLHKNRRSHQTCPHCKAGICSMCRSLAHDTNQDCPQDFGLESTLEIAESQGWRRCYSCRTMVELTTGCRHITCRCGAQFCYVCNAVWKTCNCTEADKERRIRELRAQSEQRTQMEEEERRRREEEDEAARVEAEEMAEAIRQVEEMERQDAIRRVEQERQRQLEEELMLAQLEEARLLEEIARREEEEEAERQFREILITSSKEECQAMMKTLMQIINYQHTTLMSSHKTQEENIAEEKQFEQAQETSRTDTMLHWLQENVNRRNLALNMKQQSEWEALLLQAENDEDEFFMKMHLYFRDKPNSELREKKMRDTFQAQQQDKTDRLQQRQVKERRWLEMGAGYEFEGLRKAASVRNAPLGKDDEAAFQRLGGLIGCDRQWFQLISTRRINMLNQHKKIVLRQVEAEEDPVGLTVDQARSIEPSLPIEQEAGSDPSSMEPTVVASAIFQQTETSDLYGTASERPISTSNSIHRKPVPSTPQRSDTIVRSVPGAFPTPVPASAQAPTPVSTQSLPQPQSHTEASIMSRSRPRTSQPQSQSSAEDSMMNRPRPRTSTSSNQSTTTTVSTPNQLQHQSLLLSPTANSSTTTLSPSSSTSTSTTTPSSSKHSSTHSHSSTFSTTSTSSSSTSTSTSTSTGTGTDTDTDTSFLDTIPTSIIARHSQSHEKKKSLGGLLRGFGKKKEFSEEDIRRRMSTAGVVGDSWGL